MTPIPITTAVHDGLSSALVDVESCFTRGFAGVHLIGNASDVCRDGKERAKSALESLGLTLPNKRLVISLTPADLKKDGNHLDVPMAVSLALLVLEKEPAVDPRRWLFVGELGLDGEIKATRGVVSFAMQAAAAGMDGIVVGAANLREMWALAQFDLIREGKLRVLAFPRLDGLLEWLLTGDEGEACGLPPGLADDTGSGDAGPTFDDMLLTPELALVAMAAATGMHSILMRGTPGTGKSMFAARLPSVLPGMAKEEHLEALRIQSAYAGSIPASLIRGVPPFRAPHHHASAAALLGNADTPGELSLAHGGILFLDEFPEFRRDLLESLREPMESGVVHVARAKRKVTWAARILLVAAANPCPCGWAGSARRLCHCAPPSLAHYRSRLSGPILDRIDIHVTMPELAMDATMGLAFATAGPKSGQTATMRATVAEARARADARNGRWGVRFNRDLPTDCLREASGLADEDFQPLLASHGRHYASQRSLARSLRLARTLADVAGRAAIAEDDLAQARAWQDPASAVALPAPVAARGLTVIGTSHRL